VNAERVVLLGWSRAILLQMAHPLVAAGVAEHSNFRGGPLATALRLRHTVRAMLRLAFGDQAAADRTIAGIRAIHRRVHGQLGESTGRFPAGHPYSAEDPDLLLWVHATLVESVLLAYELMVGPLTESDRDQYCEESADVAIALGARANEIPRTWRSLCAYVDQMVASGTLAVATNGRTLAHAVLYPRPRLFTGPFGWINRLVTIGLLPDQVRAHYGLSWSARRAWQLRMAVRVLRTVRRVVPFGWAEWPEARGRDAASDRGPVRLISRRL